MKNRLNYQEGTTFFIPLRGGGFARGLATRLNGRGTLFAYFFGPVFENPDGSINDLKTSDACLVGLCGDLGLIRGSWPIAGNLPGWQRENWRLPPLYRCDEQAQKAWLSFYDDVSLALIREEPTAYAEDSNQPYDRLMGYGAVEIRLTKLLKIEPRK